MILVYVVLGGIGNIRGSVIAAIILYILPEKLRFIGDYRMLVYAIVLIVVMLINWAPKALEYRDKEGEAGIDKARAIVKTLTDKYPLV